MLDDDEATSEYEAPQVGIRYATPSVFKPLYAPARYKGAYGGRGSGKSHAMAEMLIRKAIETDGLRWACIREIQKSLEQSAMRLIQDKIIKWGLGDYFEFRDKYIITPSSSGRPGIIIFQGMQNHNANSIKSLEGYHGCWIEEAHSLSAYSWSILRPTFRSDDSEIWASWNPTKETDPIDAFFRDKKPFPRLRVVEVNWDDNPYFPKSLDEERRYDLRRDPDRYAHVWMGGYLRLSGSRVFKNWTVEDFETPSDARFYFGADWGYADDPTVLVRCWIDESKRRLYVDHEAYALHCEIDQISSLFRQVPGANVWPIRADSARPDTISYVVNHSDLNIVPADKGPRSIEDGVEFLQSYDIVVHPRCRHTADELSYYSWKVDKKTEEVLPQLEDKHNHVIDSLRYALEGARKGLSMMDFL